MIAQGLFCGTVRDILERTLPNGGNVTMLVVESGGKYPKTLAAEAYGEVSTACADVRTGDEVLFTYGAESRKWEKRDGSVSWITTAKIREVEMVKKAEAKPEAEAPAEVPPEAEDYPF